MCLSILTWAFSMLCQFPFFQNPITPLFWTYNHTNIVYNIRKLEKISSCYVTGESLSDNKRIVLVKWKCQDRKAIFIVTTKWEGFVMKDDKGSFIIYR